MTGLVAALTLSALAADPSADPFLWLEDVTGDEALTWVRARNTESTGTLEADPAFAPLRDRLLSIFDDTDRIPYVSKIGASYYNFWQDAEHPRGVWRRTTLESYRTASPSWEVVLDLDALGKTEGEAWVWKGADCLGPSYERCLVFLSRGGADATVTREIELATGKFIAEGFELPEAKSRVTWLDRDHLFVATDFGEGSMTTSGYPRVVKKWTRGTPLASAEVVFEGALDDVSVGAFHSTTPGFERTILYRGKTFYTDEVYWLRDGQQVKIDKPDDCEVSAHREWIFFTPRSDWTIGKTTYKAGSLLVARFGDWVKGKKKPTALFTPTERTSLSGYSATKGHVIVNTLDNVRNVVTVHTPGRKAWTSEPLPGLPAFGGIGVSAVDGDESDAYFVTLSDYITPSSLLYGTVGAGAPETLKQLKAQFNADGLEVTQHEAVSKDGTRVPYFQVAKKGLVLDGGTPTLLYGYGGFEVSLLPGYSPGVGAGWLEKGGVYVVANIRGGGEFGPRWHQAALKEKRPRAYEDFEAVAEDLLARRVTSKDHLGIYGGSNGGLLMGNMITRRPDLWGAVVCAVPLLDMRRYHTLLAGASWMGEYGDPDVPEEWAFIEGFSPYHQAKEGVSYPPTFYVTSTRDDRVHPGHARKMAAKMLALGQPVTYYENIEGGHGGAANNSQRAMMEALRYTFLWQQLR